MKERDFQQKLASESKSRDEWMKFKSLRNRINNRLNYEERNWQKLNLRNVGEFQPNLGKCQGNSLLENFRFP